MHIALILSTVIGISRAKGLAADQACSARALIYSATADFRHDSIPTAVQALITNGPASNVQFDHTEDQTWFADDRLAQYDAIVFLQNTGEVLDTNGQAAFQRYIDSGGNFVGIHAASDCLRNSTFFDRELGAHFDYHPEIQNAIIDVIGPSHPSTANLPAQWHVFDEMYNFKADPRDIGAVVILSANESSYSDPGPRLFNQGSPHPTAWFQDHGAGAEGNGTAGRSFYTSLGHTNETWQDDTYLSHVMGGISWVVASGTTRATSASAIVGVTCANNTVTTASIVSSATVSATTLASGSVPMESYIMRSVPIALGTRTVVAFIFCILACCFW